MMSGNTAVILAFLLDWIGKGFVVLGIAFLADLQLRRANASLRHLIWLVGLAGVVLLPAASWILPSVDVPLFHLDFLRIDPALEGGFGPAGSEGGFGWGIAAILLGIYFAGALLVLIWQLIGRACALRLQRHAGKVPVGPLTRELQRLKAQLGIRNHVALLTSDLISIPFSRGYLRPVIILPRSTSTWPAPVLESVLIHELAHIKRKDVLARIAAQISCCIHWINPLAWYGLGRIMMEQEIACDNLVLSTGTKASEYACNLLVLSGVRRGRFDFALTALGRRTELKSRLLEILKPTRNRAPMRLGGFLLFSSLTLGLIMPVSALNIWDSSDAGRLIKPLSGDKQNPEQITRPQTAVNSQTSRSSMKSLPDVAKFKEGISKKIQEMKEQGVPQEEITKFTMAAKAKIESFQLQQMKQAEEKQKQIEIMKAKKGKKTE